MTKYCPACESEFQDTIIMCPDDNETLFDAPSTRVDRNLSVDIYAAGDEIEAKLIVGILEERGIFSQLFKPQISQLPALGDTHFILAVEAKQKALALEFIKEARNDGILSNTGIFL